MSDKVIQVIKIGIEYLLVAAVLAIGINVISTRNNFAAATSSRIETQSNEDNYYKYSGFNEAENIGGDEVIELMSDYRNSGLAIYVDRDKNDTPILQTDDLLVADPTAFSYNALKNRIDLWRKYVPCLVYDDFKNEKIQLINGNNVSQYRQQKGLELSGIAFVRFGTDAEILEQVKAWARNILNNLITRGTSENSDFSSKENLEKYIDRMTNGSLYGDTIGNVSGAYTAPIDGTVLNPQGTYGKYVYTPSIEKNGEVVEILDPVTITIESKEYEPQPNDTLIDQADINKGTAVNHEHLYQTFYNDTQHWQECLICHTVKDKVNHTMSNNGGLKTNCENGYYNDSYRETCTCGYSSKPQVVIHGRYENYAYCKVLNYGNMNGVSMNDIKQITKAEYQSTLYPALPGNQTYTWIDDDGDGYGWVFCGGPVQGDDRGVKGTVELVVGSEGDCGRKNVFDEYYSLAAYNQSDSTPTRQEFVNYLKNKINASSNPSRHALYGYDTKYANITDAQFNQIIASFKGYTVHVSGYGWGAMCIQHSTHRNSGSYIYSYSTCYDSSQNITVSASSGVASVCDVCGAKYTGKEAYDHTWYVCNGGNGLADGETRKCSGHRLTGINGVYLGTVYCTFKRTGHNVVRTRLDAVPAAGATATGYEITWTKNADGSLTGASCNCDTQDNASSLSYKYIGRVYFNLNGNSNSIYCGYYYILTDDTNPSAYGYTDENCNNSNWKITGNGTVAVKSTAARLTVTFQDPDQYTLTTLKVHVYDSDQKTIIRQSNGDEWTPLKRTSGTPKSGKAGIWSGTIDICTETSGSKYIYIQAQDSTGKKSELVKVKITNLDSKAPEITIQSSSNLNQRSKYKSFIVSATDDDSTIYIGISQEDILDVSVDGRGNKRTYIISGNYEGRKDITFYAKDSAGNMSYKTVTFYDLDSSYEAIQ